MNYVEGKPDLATVESGKLSEYIEIVEKWKDFRETGDYAVYRGHVDYNWILVARLFRDPHAKRENNNSDDEAGIEKQLISENLPYEFAHELERELFDEFTIYLYSFRPDLAITVPEGNTLAMLEWRQLALAQHYGLPTRFLDFTTNMLAALFFAVEGTTSRRVTTTGEEMEQDSAVWCIEVPLRKKVWEVWPEDGNWLGEDRVWLTPKKFAELGHDPEIVAFIDRAFIPEHFDDRIRVQGSVFMCEPRGKDPRWTLHTKLRDKTNTINPKSKKPKNSRTLKIRVPKNVRNSLLDQLDQIGVNRANLFPDLGSAATYLDWKIYQRK